MMRKMLACLMLFLLFVLPAAAETSGDWEYSVRPDGSISLDGCLNEKAKKLEIPAEIDGKPVVWIGKNAFASMKSLTTVVIPDSVATIASGAFASCPKLSKVQLGEGLLVIQSRAFEWCEALQSITLPQSLTTIGEKAFAQAGLTKLTVPENVISIGEEAFSSNRQKLRDITFEGREPFAEVSDKRLFNGDYTRSSDINTIYPLTIRCEAGSTPDRVFRHPDIKKVYPKLSSYETVTAAADRLLSTTVDLRNAVVVEVPEGVEEIASYAFSGMKYLRKIILPSTLKTIGNHAFAKCPALEEIVWNGAQITEIPDHAFLECHNLTTIKLPDTVEVIGVQAFGECETLSSVTWPKALKRIENAAFAGCEALAAVKLPEGTEFVGENAFRQCYGLKTLVLPDSVTTLGDAAFASCLYMTKATLSKNLTVIPYGAFYRCMSLKSLTIPEGVTVLEAASLKDCTDLATVKFPSTLREIGEQALMNSFAYDKQSKGLSALSLPEGLEVIGPGAFIGQVNVKKVIIPESVISIGDAAFSNMSMGSITVPASVQQMGTNVFANCRSLKKVNWLCMQNISEHMFYQCTALTEIVVPEGMTRIGEKAFWECEKLQSVTLPESLVEIGADAFGGIHPKAVFHCPEGSEAERLIAQMQSADE